MLGLTLSGIVCINVCGDGFVYAPEVCDDGNDTDGKGCSTGCSGVNPLYSCVTDTVTPTTPASICKPFCGDGKVLTSEGETCDDNNLGGCNSTCTGPNPGWTCTGGDPVTATTC